MDESRLPNRLIVRETDEFKLTGQYLIGFKAHHNSFKTYAKNIVKMPEPYLTINIVDPCASPLSVMPALDHQEDRVVEYMITSGARTISFEPFI